MHPSIRRKINENSVIASSIAYPPKRYKDVALNVISSGVGILGGLLYVLAAALGRHVSAIPFAVNTKYSSTPVNKSRI